jgi:hypothetical protein
MKFAVGPGHVYFSFYERFSIQMSKNVCLSCKEPFNLLILGSLISGGFLFLEGSPTQTEKTP